MSNDHLEVNGRWLGTVGFVSGAFAGLAGDLTTHPIDTIKTRLQTQHPKLYVGVFDALKKTIINEGLGALYKGFGAVSALTIPAHALYFGAYEVTRLGLQRDRPPEAKSSWVYFVSGLNADMFGSIIWIPMDIAKQRLQIQNRCAQYKSPMDVWKSVLKTDGISGLYKGGLISIMTYGPFVGIYFATYERLKQFFTNKFQQRHHVFLHLTCGIFAGAFASTLTCPLDVIKTNVQTQRSNRRILTHVTDLYVSHGFTAFFRGLSARTLWITINSAVTITFYEQFKLAFNKI